VHHHAQPTNIFKCIIELTHTKKIPNRSKIKKESSAKAISICIDDISTLRDINCRAEFTNIIHRQMLCIKNLPVAYSCNPRYLGG
jgi:hypothetical protein